MRVLLLTVLAAGLFATLPGTLYAADVARLEWGGFVVEDDTSDGWANYKYLPSDDGRSITMTFAPIEAKADGATVEAKARLRGHFDLIQPRIDSFTNYVVSTEGHVIKSGGAMTRLVLTVGSAENILEWTTGAVVSEKFNRKMEFALPAEGRLPNPFTVSIEVYARKDGPADAAYVSVDSLTITAANAQVVSN